MTIKQCNRNPFFLADFAYDGEFSDGEKFCLRIPERDVIPFAEALLKAYADDMNGDVMVTIPHVKYEYLRYHRQLANSQLTALSLSSLD